MANIKSWIRMAYGVIRASWWIVALVIAFVLFVTLYLVKKFRNDGVPGGSVINTKPFIGEVASRIQGSITDIKVERAIINADTSFRRKELEEIRKEKDGKKRREKLANVLQGI